MRRRVRWWSAAFGVLVIAALVVSAAPWSLSGAFVRRAFALQVRVSTGLQASASGRAVFSLLPTPRLKFEMVSVGDTEGGLLLEAPVVEGILSLPALLQGRIVFSTLQFSSPTIALNSAFRRELGSVLAALARDDGSASPLPMIVLVGGIARLADGANGQETLVTDIDATLDWRQSSAPAALSARATWRGQRGSMEMWIGDPARLLAGGESSATLRLRSAVLDLGTTGMLAAGPRLQYIARLTASSASPTALLRVLGAGSSDWPGGERVALAAQATISQTGLSLSAGHLTLPSGDFEGAAAVRLDHGVTSVSATMATNLLSLDAQSFSALGHLASSREPADWLQGGELDLRLSAARVQVGSIRLEDAALSAQAQAGKAELSLGEARGYGGQIRLRGALAAGADDLPELRASLALTTFDMTAFQHDAGALSALTGIATGQIAATSADRTWPGLLTRAEGGGNVTLTQGLLEGIDIEQALRRREKRGSATPVALLRSGSTAFKQGQASFTLAGGRAWITGGNLSGPGATVAFEGTVDLATKETDITGQATQPGGTGVDAPALLMNVSGPLGAPRLRITGD